MKNIILYDVKEEEKENWVKFQSYNFQIEVKKFLTIEQIKEIVDGVLSYDNETEAMIFYYCVLAEFATNIDISQFKDDNDMIDASAIYNALAENCLLDFVSMITNISDVERIIRKERDVYKVAVSLAESIGESLQGFNTKEFTEAMGQLKEIADRPNIIDFDNAKAKKKK